MHKLAWIILWLLADRVACADANSTEGLMRAVHVPSAVQPHVYIVNGEQAKLGELPWQVSVQVMTSKNIFMKFYAAICGGSIIGPYTVVTAAHCVEDKGPYRIVAGVTRLDNSRPGSAQVRDVEQVVVHPKWDTDLIKNDVAVLLLSRQLHFDENVQPIPMASSHFDPTDACIASGWGRLSEGGGPAKNLMKVRLNVVEKDQCAKLYRNVANARISDSVICAGGHDGRSACSGDSGGPLVCVNSTGSRVLTGVTSYGVVCGDNHPTVFTRVSAYYDWIAASSSASHQTISAVAVFVFAISLWALR